MEFEILKDDLLDLKLMENYERKDIIRSLTENSSASEISYKKFMY